MPVDMRKLTLIALLAIIMIALAIGAYVFISGSGDATEPDDGHFSITGLSDLQYFNGESVIVRAVVTNDEPPENESVSDATNATGDNNANTSKTALASPGAVAQPSGSTDVQTVIAELKGAQGYSIARIKYVPLAYNVPAAIVFDFGQVPVGSYVATVRVSGYNASATNASVAVKPTPLINEWTSIGDVAFLLDNLGHDHVDVNIRNNGQHTVMFGDQHYNIFLNCSDGYGVALQGLNETLVWPGTTVTVRAKIPLARSYYLDYFSIAVPGRAELVKFPWGVQMAATV
jgi:hypothetical protein